MTFEKLTRTQLNALSGNAPNQEYISFLSGLKAGEGGRTTVKKAKVGRQTIKNRLRKTASHLGVEIKFRRSPAEEVVFEIVKGK